MTSPDPTPTAPPRFERPADGRKIAGVCAAVARRQRLDPTVVRVLALVLVLFGGVGVIAYFAGLMLIPAEGAQEPLIREGAGGAERKTVIVLGLAATIAVLTLGDEPFSLFGGDGVAFVAIVALLGAGVLALRGEGSGGPPAADVSTTAVHPTVAAAPTPRRRGRSVAILGGALLTFAAAGGVLAAIDGDVRWDVALCASVVVVGGLLVVSAPLGGARILVPLGAVLALLAGGAAAADLNLRGEVGDHLEHPAALATGKTEYVMAAGRLMVDLRDADLPAGVTDVSADLGFGQLVVRVPEGVRVELQGRAAAGEIDTFGRDAEGLDVTRTDVLPGRADGRVLRVDAHVGFGEVRFVSAGRPLPRLSDDSSVTGLPEAER